MKSRNTIPLLALVAALVAGAGAPAPQAQHDDEPLTSKLGEFPIPPSSHLAEVADALWLRVEGLSINMESIPYDYENPETFVTLEEMIERYETKLRAVGLVPWEIRRLDDLWAMVGQVEESPAEHRIAVDYRPLVEGYEPVRLAENSIGQILDQLVLRAPDYAWESPSPGVVRIRPSGQDGSPSRSQLDWTFPAVSTGTEGMLLTEFLALEEVATAFAAHQVSVANSQWLTGKERLSLEIPTGTTAAGAFDLIASRLGEPGQHSWYVHHVKYGVSETRTLVLTFNTRRRVAEEDLPSADQVDSD